MIAAELSSSRQLAGEPISRPVAIRTLGCEHRRSFLILCYGLGWTESILQQPVSSKVERGTLFAGSQRVAYLPLPRRGVGHHSGRHKDVMFWL